MPNALGPGPGFGPGPGPGPAPGPGPGLGLRNAALQVFWCLALNYYFICKPGTGRPADQQPN